MLVGEGSHLKVFDVLTSKYLTQCKIFDAQTVHGIAITNPSDHENASSIKAACWGGKSFVLLDTEILEGIVHGALKSIVAFASVAPDWILDGSMSPFRSGTECVFVTAHSTVLKAVPRHNPGRGILKSLVSPSRSVLYSAHAVWTDVGSILLAGGTVFGEIEVIVWQNVNDDVFVRGRQLFTFSGHEGSIFGVQISPEIIGQDGRPTRYLASCSDDRTIRVWNLSSRTDGRKSTDSEPKSSSSIRQTGFGENENNSAKDTSAKRCMATVMAHASRIWHVDFIVWKGISPDSTTKVNLLSFGEDSTCQQWSIDFLKSSGELQGRNSLNTETHNTTSSLAFPAVLNRLNTFAYHIGKHIWSTALLYVSETSRRLMTGGADGKVAIYDIFLETSSESLSLRRTISSHAVVEAPIQSDPLITTCNWAVEDVFQHITPPKKYIQEAFAGSVPMTGSSKADNSGKGKKKKTAQMIKDSPNRYAFIARNELLITTSFGKVLFASITESIKWKEINLPYMLDHALRSYSLLLGMPDIGIAFLAGAGGTIYIFHSKEMITELIKVPGKPAALFNISKAGEGRLQILVTTLGSDIASRLSVAVSDMQSPSLEEVVTIKLPQGFVVTSAAVIRNSLLLGARNGSIAVYETDSITEPLDVFTGQQAYHDDAITSIITPPSPEVQDNRFHFLSTCRNGSYSILSLSIALVPGTSSKEVSLNLVHQAFPPLGPMIEAAWFNNSDLMLYGFRSKNFVVWNETKQSEVANVECGGAHRSYAYLTSPDAGGAGHFAYTKASRIYLHSQNHPSHTVLKSGGHGREIKACAKHLDFIATGAEDTVIRIFRVHREGGEPPKINITVDGEAGQYGDVSLECCAAIEKHTAGIQYLQWSCTTEDYHSLFSGGGNEEFYVWAISEIPSFGVGVVCEAALTDKSEDGDLRIMGFAVENIHDYSLRKVVDGVTEKRKAGKNKINLIYSDSTIKCYDYSRSLGFQKTAEGKYTSACLTQSMLLNETRGRKYLFTTSTDGHLVLWDLPQRVLIPSQGIITADVKCLSSLQLHQSSISALAIQRLGLIGPYGGLLVATGGDDNAITITFFYNLQPVKRITIPSAHAAGITGVQFRSDCTGGMAEDKWYQLWTVGGDQRVKRWTIEFGQHDEVPKPTMENGLNMRVWRMEEGDDVWCSVADPAGLVTWRNNFDEERALVYGNGMEVFKLDDGSPNGDGMRWEGITWDKKVKRWEEEVDEEYYEEEGYLNEGKLKETVEPVGEENDDN